MKAPLRIYYITNINISKEVKNTKGLMEAIWVTVLFIHESGYH